MKLDIDRVSSFAAFSAAAFTSGGNRNDTGRVLGVSTGGRPMAFTKSSQQLI